MKQNEIKLEFEKSLTNLAGYDFGISVYKEQVEGELDLSMAFKIIFPEQIKGVAASFVQGFFSEIVEKIGLLATEELVQIQARNERLEKSVISKLM